MPSVGSIYVPSEGPKEAALMLVGEAPGEVEEVDRRPFVGPAGSFLRRYIDRAGGSVDDCYFTNLCKYRPEKNKFENLLGSTELAKGLLELKEEIFTVNPNVIVALGNWPMYYLTGKKSDKKNAESGSGITQWRGSVIPCKLVDGYKVCITYHPSHIIRADGFVNHPIFERDLHRAVKESASKEYNYPKYREIIDPPEDELMGLAGEIVRAEWCSVDIETFGPQLACIGFYIGGDWALCLTLFNQAINWPIARAILESNVPKILQYGLYDINYVWWFLRWVVNNYKWDTYVCENSINPGFPKKLEQLTSIYTPMPFYKSERKSWKPTHDVNILWRYNLKDVVATFLAAMEQKEILYGIP